MSETPPHLPHSTSCHKLENLPLGDNRVVQIEATVLPLYRAIDVQCIAQPEVGGASGVRGESQDFSPGRDHGKGCWNPTGPTHPMDPDPSPGLEFLGAE